MTFAPAMVPVEFVRLQCSPAGCVCTTTVQVAPSATDVDSVKPVAFEATAA